MAPMGPRHGYSHPTVVLALWLIVQLAALALACGQVRLSAGFPPQAEQMGLMEMLVVQFVFGGMAFPILLGDGWSLAMIVLIAGPMLQLAGLLGAVPVVDIAWVWGCLALWLIALSLLARRELSRLHFGAIALVNLVSIGGLLVWYLESEFGGWGEIARYFPIPATIRALEYEADWTSPLSSTAVILGVSAIVYWAFRAKNQPR